jgi:hypothetical protein
MAKQMLNVSDGSTSTQQPSGENLSQIVTLHRNRSEQMAISGFRGFPAIYRKKAGGGELIR